jgi:DNA helicase-4
MQEKFMILVFASVLLIIAFNYVSFHLFPKRKRVNKKNYEAKTYLTQQGETVKSYGELRIANYLKWRGINYEYEHTYVRTEGGVNKPDFYLTDYNIYIEYFGMCNLDAQYNREMHLKFDTFADEGMKVINIYRKHITNKTLGKGLEAGFRGFTGQSLPYNRKQKKEVEAKV